MLWFKKKKASRETREAFLYLAERTASRLHGSVQDSKLIFSDCQIDLANADEKNKFNAELQKHLSRLPPKYDDWIHGPRRIDEMNQSELEANGRDRFRDGASAFAMEIVRLDFCCKVALAFPDDKKIQAPVFRAMALVSDVLDKVLSCDRPLASFQRPSTGLFHSLPSTQKFFSKVGDGALPG